MGNKDIAGVDGLLFRAVAKGDLDTVRERIAAGADVNAGDNERYPPLFVAAAIGHRELVRELISAGADVNRMAKLEFEKSPSTALIGAIKYGHFEITQELVAAGGDAGLEVRPGHNAANEAAYKAAEFYWRAHGEGNALLGGAMATQKLREPHRNAAARWLQFVREAIDRGIRIQGYCLLEALKLRYEELALLLIESGINPNFASRGITTLQMAISQRLSKAALALVAAGADVNRCEQLSEPPLLLAVTDGDIALTQALLSAGADIDVKGNVMVGESTVPAFLMESRDSIRINVSGLLSDPLYAQASTPLIVAARRGDHALVKELLGHGADVNLIDRAGKTALQWALELGHTEIVQALREISR